MPDRQDGITYQPEYATERRSRVELAGVAPELVRVPPITHSFARNAAEHMMMFTERGERRDGESRVYGRAVSTLRDTSRTFSLIPANCPYEGWTEPSVPARYLSLAIDPATPLLDAMHGLAALAAAPALYRTDLPPRCGRPSVSCVARWPNRAASMRCMARRCWRC